MISQPKVLVLLAAYNGESFIEQQIESILGQKEVNVTIFISVDLSTDKTLKICKKYESNNKNIKIVSNGEKFGTSSKNFLHLIKQSNSAEFDLLAFSDQDDIWFERRLINAFEKIKQENKDAYSSNAIAFWPNKKTYHIKKSPIQKKYDFVFESPGPGCSFVISRELFTHLQNFLIKKCIKSIPYHDWWIYSWARLHNYEWIIDDEPTLFYRQHLNNQIGVNYGWQALIKRGTLILKKEYKRQVNENLLSCGLTEKQIFCLRKKLICHPLNLRRKKIHSIFIFIMILIGLA